MLNMSWTKEAEIKGHLKLKKDPFWYGLGIYEDEDGVRWDIHGVIGGKNPYVQARRIGLHPNYYGTHNGASSCGFHTWEPYTVEAPKHG
jgi:hypothetical protein